MSAAEFASSVIIAAIASYGNEGASHTDISLKVSMKILNDAGQEIFPNHRALSDDILRVLIGGLYQKGLIQSEMRHGGMRWVLNQQGIANDQAIQDLKRRVGYLEDELAKLKRLM